MKHVILTIFALLSSLSTAYCQTGDFESTRLLAEQGNAEAQNNLGTMYDFGQGVAENKSEAVKWYRLAAEQGFLEAQNQLGLMYSFGEGVPMDNLAAYVWFSVAVARGHEFAGDYLAGTATQLTPEQIAKGKEIANRCIESGYKDCEE